MVSNRGAGSSFATPAPPPWNSPASFKRMKVSRRSDTALQLEMM